MGAKITSKSYRLRGWRSTLDRLVAETGTSLADVSEYIGLSGGNDVPVFYTKLPRRRSTFIGIGMAFRQPAEVINQWITSYAGKRRLYVKDISEDLVWLYLINANLKDTSNSTNYYLRYEEYQSVAYAAFRERWDELNIGIVETADVEFSLGQADYGPEYDGIKAFVAEHMEAFSSAYSKPRTFLDTWLQQIIATCREDPEQTIISNLNSMRGWLDDSMINFLSGDCSTVNVIDRKTGKKCINIKKAQFLAPWDMKNCIEKVRQSGNDNVMICERGTTFGYNTLVVDMTGLRVMKNMGVPVIFDATHSVQKPGGNGSSTGGNRQYVEYLAKAAVAVGVDGLFIETHPDPDIAKSDGPNMVPLGEMEILLKKLQKVYEAVNET